VEPELYRFLDSPVAVTQVAIPAQAADKEIRVGTVGGEDKITGQDLTGGIRMARRGEYGRLVEILRRLAACKDMSDRSGAFNPASWSKQP
jgi:hypothetical protein